MTKISLKVKETDHQTIYRTVYTELTAEEIAGKKSFGFIQGYVDERKTRSINIAVNKIAHVFEEE